MADHVTLGGVCKLLGVSDATASKYASRPDFPAPVAHLAGARVWVRSEVERWGKANLPLRVGRPKKPLG